MSPELLKEIIAELNDRLVGGVVSKIHQPDDRDIVLRIFARGATLRLLISTHPRFSRLHLSVADFTNPPAPKRFCAFLRSRVEGARIESFSQLDDERIALLALVKRDGNTTESYVLRAELTGKSANVILLDEAGITLDALKYFYPEDSARPVVPGLALAPLPSAPQRQEEPFAKGDAALWNEAADKYYSALLSTEGAGTHRSRLNRALANAEARSLRKLANLSNDKQRAVGFQDSTRLGNILLANFKTLRKGLKEVEAIDYTVVPATTVVIPLDEKLGPKENVDKFFKRAKKAKVALAILAGRIPQTEREIEYIQELLYELESAETDADLDSVEEEILEAGYMKRAKPPVKKETPDIEPIRRSTSSEGFEMLCGKSGTGNDLIVKRYAKDGDIWLHAKGCPGSHVLIKAAGRAKEMTMKSVEEAAALAASHSKARSATRVEVIYTDATNVRKPKGAPPGTVTVSEYKTVVVKGE